MAKQLYKGPPTGMLPMDGSIIMRGWRYKGTDALGQSMREPYYMFWVDGGDRFGAYPFKAISLWWNGARWVVWITNLFVGESTEFKDSNDPPLEWAESMYTLVNK